MSFAGDKFTEKHNLNKNTKQLKPGAREFFVESRHPIEDISDVIFKWSWSLATNPYLNVERITVEPTYLFPHSKNVESKKEFFGSGVTKVVTDEKIRFGRGYTNRVHRDKDPATEGPTEGPTERPTEIKEDRKVVIDHDNMSQDKKDHAINTVIRAMDENKSHKDTAIFLKDEFNEKYGKYWECVVGRDFDFYVEHNHSDCIDFSVGGMKILLFRK